MSMKLPETEAGPADHPLAAPELTVTGSATNNDPGTRRPSGLLSDDNGNESSMFGSSSSFSVHSGASMLDPLSNASVSTSAPAVEEEEEHHMRILEESPETEHEQPLLDSTHDMDSSESKNSHQKSSYKPRTVSRVGSACKFVCVGLALSAAALGVLIYQERHAVNLQEYYQHAREIVHEITSDTDATSTFGLVHITGDASVQVADSSSSSDSAVLQDNETGIVSDSAIKLLRVAQMWQWVESDDLNKNGDYTYDLEWFATFQDSNLFIEEHHPNNPSSMPFEDHTFLPSTRVQIMNDQWIISPELLRTLDAYQMLDLKPSQISKDFSDAMKFASVQQEPDGTSALYIPASASEDNEQNNATQPTRNPAQDPQLGDTRIQYKIVPEQTISIVALWNDTSRQLEAYQEAWMRHSAKPLFLVQSGSASAQQMLDDAWKEEQPHLFILRVSCGVLLYLGLLVLAKPLSILEDLIPQLQDVVGPDFVLHIALIGMAPISVAVVCSTMALCWLGTHPGLSILYFVLQVFAVHYIGRKMVWWGNHQSSTAAGKKAVQQMDRDIAANDTNYHLVPDEMTSMELNEV